MGFLDGMFSGQNGDQLGAQIGQALGMAWMGNLARDRIDAAKKAAQQMYAPTDDDLKQARTALGQQYQGIVGSTPQQGIIDSKRRWLQAQNDAQYLLDHGYDEKSNEVQTYRQQQQAAHSDADQFRNLAKAKGIDVSKVGDGIYSLQQAKDLSSLGQQYGALGAQGITNPYVANKLSLGVNTDFLQQARDGSAQQQPISPEAVAGRMAGNSAQPGQQQARPYSFSVQDVQQAAKQLNDNPNTITIQDMYNAFGNGTTYDSAVSQAANALAAQRMQAMQASPNYKDMMKEQLVKRGIDPGVADKYLADEEAKRNEQLKQQAQAALLIAMKNNPQGAALVNYALRSGADPKDTISAFDKSKADYQMGQVDTDDKKYAIMFDKNGLLPGNMQAFDVGISPYHKGSLAVTQRGQDMNYKTAAMRAQMAAALKKAELDQNMYLYQNGLKGNRGKNGKGDKLNPKQQETYNGITNQFNDALEMVTNGAADGSDSGDTVNDFHETIENAIEKGLVPPDATTTLRNQDYHLQFLREKRAGHEDAAANAWNNMTDDYKEQYLPNY